MAPFAEALQGLQRPSASAAKTKTTNGSSGGPGPSPLTARRGAGSGGGGPLWMQTTKGGAILRPRRKRGNSEEEEEEEERGLAATAEEGQEWEEGARLGGAGEAGLGVSKSLLAAGVLLPVLLALGVALYQSGVLTAAVGGGAGQGGVPNLAEAFKAVEAKVTELGPWGYALFAGIYILAEVSGGVEVDGTDGLGGLVDRLGFGGLSLGWVGCEVGCTLQVEGALSSTCTDHDQPIRSPNNIIRCWPSPPCP